MRDGSGGKPMSDANKDLVRRWFEEGFNDRNTDVFKEAIEGFLPHKK